MASTNTPVDPSFQETRSAINDPPETGIDTSSDQTLAIEKEPTPALNMEARKTEAEQVRRQVAHYFSAESLQRDKFLLQKMKGRKNKPIPAKTVAGFPLMRQYQPLEFVVEALKTSSEVDIVKGNGVDCIKRKEPFIMPEHLKATNTTVWAKVSVASGFETYFTEGPLPPDVAAEEAEIYNQENTFEDRMEHAIRNYLGRRKFSSSMSNYFTKWMRFGGVDTQPHAHVQNAVDPEELQGLTTKEKKAAVIPKPYLAGEEMDSEGNALWDIDFEGVAKAFLSSIVPELFSFNRRDQYDELTNVMQNFLRYLQYHRVCPEYNTALNATMRICDQADRELPACETLQTNLPGAFNTAASTLFGGVFSEAFVGDQEWASAEASAGIDIAHGLQGKDARTIFLSGLVSMQRSTVGTKTQLTKEYIDSQFITIRRSNIGLEIVEVHPPTEEATAFYAGLGGAGLEPLGLLVCKPWYAPDFFDWDLPKSIAPGKADKGLTYTFLLEETLLQNCHVGFKFENASVATLEPIGIQILDGIPSHTRASFYTVLENELVMKWKPPRFITREEQKEREERLASARDLPMPQVDTGAVSGDGSEESNDDDL